ncbi:amino acid ABC transporter permease [Ferrimicrobium sp.]|uniref:amino acid ABC transporter permease n=1 Tax=Ferrimicrobium sp. TaxID=2926050 RepID=UPI00261AB597|nr:amino acid ABC transporter permease [Ferrimicrobium sp.]
MSAIELYTRAMLDGAVVTVELAIGGSLVSLVVGAIGAVGRLYGPKPVKVLIYGYVELIRGLPAILQLFILYFGLTQFGIDIPAYWAAFLWMCLYGTGYAIEIYRAGLQSVHEGQHEATAALGLTRTEAMRKVIIPQAWVAMLPAITSFVVLELKNTTLVYFIGVEDIMFHARLGVSNSGNPLAIYGIAALMYVIMNGLISRIGALLEKRAAIAN